MSDEGGGKRWGPFWSGPARTVIPAVIIVGASGYAIYRNKQLSSRDVIPPPTNASGGNDGGGGGEALATPEIHAEGAGPVEKVVEFITDPTALTVGGMVIISALALLGARWSLSSRKQAA